MGRLDYTSPRPDGLTCTRCFQPTGEQPDWDGLPVQQQIDLCQNWLCRDCLDDAEREACDPLLNNPCGQSDCPRCNPQ